MPGRDGTGPMGAGAMTGRGMGLCTTVPGNAGSGFGFGKGQGLGRRLGCGRGYGRGRGFGAGYGAGVPVQPVDRQDQIAILKEQALQLEGSLQTVKERLSSLENAAE